MEFSGPVTHLTTGILQVGSFFRAGEPSGFAVPCRMAYIAALDLLFCQTFPYPFDALI